MSRTVRQASTPPSQLQATMDEVGEAFEEFKDKYSDKCADLEDRIGEMEAAANARRFENNSGRGRISRAFSDELRQLQQKGNGAHMDVPFSPRMAITVGNESAEILHGIDDIARRTSPVMNLVKNVQSETGNIGYIVTDLAASGSWIAEGGARSETATSTFNKVDPTGNFCYARMKVSEEAIMDSSFDLADFILEESGRILGQLVGRVICTGTSSEQPTGFLHGNAVSPLTIVSTADMASPIRPFGSVQYLPTGAAAGFQADYIGGIASPVQDPSACLFDALYALNPIYRSNSTWLMNSATLGLVRKFRDADGNLLFAPGLVTGQDATLLGRPIVLAEDMPDPAANAIPIAIGDWSRGYLLVSVGGLRITADESITTPGQNLYYVRRRYQGAVLDSQAIKCIKCATS